MSQTFRIGPARLLTASSFDAPIPSWTDLGMSRGNAVVTLSNVDKAVGRTDQEGRRADAVFQTPSPMEVRFLMTDRDVLKLVEAFPLSARLTSGAKEALGLTTIPARITTRAFALVPEEDYTVEGSFQNSEFVAYFKEAYLSIDTIVVANPIEDTDDALSSTAFEVRVMRALGAESGYGYPLATGESFQGVLFAYQPSIDALAPFMGDAAVFSRASTATYVDSNGIIQTAAIDTPRYQDGGLLLEPQRTNLALKSEEMDAASWYPAQVTETVNATTAPDGTATADKIVEDGNNAAHYTYQPVTVSSGTTYTVSVFVKKAERSIAYIRFSSYLSGFVQSYAYFDVDAGTPLTIEAGIASYGIEDFGNGWYRIWASSQATASIAANVGFGFTTADNTQTHAGDSSSGIYAWGFQTEAGAYSTSYIPTSGSTVTRNADVFSAPRPSGLSVQTDFSAIINAVPLFGDGEQTTGITSFRLFGDSTPRVNALFPSSSPDLYYSEVAGFSVDSSEVIFGGTVTKNEDMEALFVSDSDGDFTYTIHEEGTAGTPDTFAWSAVKNSTDEWGGTDVIEFVNGAWILKSLLVTSGLLTYDQIRSILR